MAYMHVNYHIDQYGWGFPNNLLSSEYGGHLVNAYLTEDCSNGCLISVDTSKEYDFDVFEQKAATKFEGTVLRQMQDGSWLVLVTDPGDALFLYQKPLSPHQELREFMKESAMYNKAGDIVRAYCLYKFDRFSSSEENFDGTPEPGAKISGVSNKKMVIAASGQGGEGQGADPTPTVTYEAVASPTGNPSTSGYYELVEGAYVASTDTEVDPTKTYYVVKQ